MKNGITKVAIVFALLLISNFAFGQSETGGASYFIYALIIIAVLMFFYLIIQVADNLMAIEAKQTGADKSGANFSIFPNFSELLAPKLPDYTGDDQVTVLKRGHDILLEGGADGNISNAGQVKTFAVQPVNFRGLSPIPKVEVEAGDHVKAGDILFFDKKVPEIKYAAPVSGKVLAVNRGAKRAISEIVIEADKEIQYRDYPALDLDSVKREELVEYLLESGAWPLIRQRPFDVVADFKEAPRDIFITTFDTAPLAPDLNLVVEGRQVAFQKGLDVLNLLTEGKVHLGLNAKGENAPSSVFTEAKGVELNWFHGKHPAGNVGVQIHHTAPIGSKDKVWILGVQEVISLGALFSEGRFNTERVIALTGGELKEPKYVRTYLGANIGELTNDNLKGKKVRLISGDVLSGKQKVASEFLDFFDDQVSAIEEGDYYEMFGWLLPITPRPSISKTFPNFLFPDLKFKADTNTHGEKRAFVMTGQYEKVLPMDIYPQHLMKAILFNDFEQMEGLGIYELSEEDVALCEFVCTSKQPLQQILRRGLDTVREQS